jgi:protease-4
VRRAIRFVLALIAVAVLVSVLGTVVLYELVAREPAVAQRSTLILRPGGDLPDAGPTDFVGQFIGAETTTVRSYIESLRKAKRDPRIANVLLMPTELSTPYWANVQELRDAVVDFRTSGKAVVAFLEYGGNREYYLASAASRVFLVPTSSLDLTGVASFEIFLRGTLDKIGVFPDFLHIGAYKTAPNELTEKTFTPAHREMAESLNQEAYAQLVRGIASGRHKSEAEVRALVDRGPFLPSEALKAGLVDELAYEDQLDDKIPELKAAANAATRIEGTDYARTSERAAGFRARSKVAVLSAAGAIVSGRGGFDPLNGPSVGSDTLVEQIRRIRADASVKAIVLRINSPGGSSTASDVIWRELMITRDQRPSRPLIVSMADLAASGGYYIATPGQVLVAEPGTLTGSIGIYGGKMVTSGALQKVEANMEMVASGRNAGMESPIAPYTPSQRAAMQQILTDFYATFLRRVADSRHMSTEEVDRLGQGRVWTGAQAKERHLVDMLGGLDTAIAIAKQRAGIPATEDVELVVYPGRRSLYDALLRQFSGSRLSVSLWPAWMGTVASRPPIAPLGLFRRGEPLALMPFAFAR